MVHRVDIAKRTAVVEVDASGGLQWPCRTKGAFANDMTCGQHGLDGRGLYLAHADGVDVADDNVRDVLGREVAVVLALWFNVIRRPYGVFQPAGTFLVACPEDFCFLIEERANQISRHSSNLHRNIRNPCKHMGSQCKNMKKNRKNKFTQN